MTEPPTGGWPKIRARRAIAVSPWMKLIERDVEFTPDTPVETYHAVGQNDYVAILAMTPERRIPLVHQYRPACETFTLELPAGMVEEGEAPADTCRRELQEETGFPALKVHALASNSPCTARLSNRIHSFFVEAGDRMAGFRPEAGISVKMVGEDELMRLIAEGRLDLQLHIATVFLAQLRGLIAPAKAAR